MESELDTALDDLNELTYEYEPWKPTSILVTAELRNVTTKEKKQCIINLIDYMGRGPDSTIYQRLKKEPHLRTEGHKSPVIFPEFTDSTEETRRSISERLKKLCALEGFVLSAPRWDVSKNRMVFCCRHKRIHKNRLRKSATKAAPETNQAAPETNQAAPETNQAAPETNQAAPETNKAVSNWFGREYPQVVSYEHPCEFGFQVNYKVEEKCWVFLTGTGNPNHSHHMKLNKGVISNDTRTFEYNKLLDRHKDSAVCCTTAPSSSSADITLDKWKENSYSSYDTFLPTIKELFDSADRSFRVHEYLQDIFARELPIVHRLEEGDPNHKRHQAAQVQRAAISSLTKGGNSQSKRRSVNPGGSPKTPRSKKQREEG